MRRWTLSRRLSLPDAYDAISVAVLADGNPVCHSAQHQRCDRRHPQPADSVADGRANRRKPGQGGESESYSPAAIGFAYASSPRVCISHVIAIVGLAGHLAARSCRQRCVHTQQRWRRCPCPARRMRCTVRTRTHSKRPQTCSAAKAFEMRQRPPGKPNTHHAPSHVHALRTNSTQHVESECVCSRRAGRPMRLPARRVN